MSTRIKFAFAAAVMAMGLASPVTSPVMAHTLHRHYAAAHAATLCPCGANNGTLYNYVPAQDDNGYWPSAAALGNSH